MTATSRGDGAPASDEIAFALDAVITLVRDVDPASPGAEVTVALCGHWGHEGRCRWPHNTRIDTSSPCARMRTVVVAPRLDRDDIAGRVESALRRDTRWSVIGFTLGEITESEQALVNRLAHRTD